MLPVNSRDGAVECLHNFHAGHTHLWPDPPPMMWGSLVRFLEWRNQGICTLVLRVKIVASMFGLDHKCWQGWEVHLKRKVIVFVIESFSRWIPLATKWFCLIGVWWLYIHCKPFLGLRGFSCWMLWRIIDITKQSIFGSCKQLRKLRDRAYRDLRQRRNKDKFNLH